MTKRMILMLFAVIVIFGGIFGFKAFVNHMMTDFFDNMPAPVPTITATEVTEDQWTPSTEAVGTFVAVDGAELTTEVGGIVTGIHFENGDRVEAGQLLVSLDITTDEAELNRLVAADRLARQELERFERLFRQSSVSQSDLERRQSEAAQAAAAVETQRARIRQKIIRAPFDGTAGIRRVNVGQFVGAGEPVVAVEALDPIYLNFSLPEQRLAQIHSGQRLRVHADAWGEHAFEGEVSAIAPRVSASTRTFEVQATFSNPEERLLPGMFGRVQIDTGEAETVLVLPQTAIQFNTYGNAVFVVEDRDGEQVVTQRFIRTGSTRGDLVAVLEGLEVGDRVATSGLLKLRNGATVRISDNRDAVPTADPDPRPANR